MSHQADVKSGTDDAAASFMRARRPVFGIAYSMLGSASEASEKPAALQPNYSNGLADISETKRLRFRK